MFEWLYYPVIAKLWYLVALFAWTSPHAEADATAPIPELTASYASVVASSSHIPLPPTPDEHGIAARYGAPGDKFAQQGTACAPHAKINDVDHVCAHRRYPCGTILIVENQKTKDRNWCVVLDRGPFGASVFAADGTKVMVKPKKAAWYIKIREGDLPPDSLCPDGECVGKWRGVLDVSPAVSRGMNHTGWGNVKVWKLRRVVDLQRYLAKKASRPVI
jgi:hypothetical protein